MPQTILGIDIGSYSIKIAEVERSFKGYEFVNFYERAIQYNELLKPEESLMVTLQGMMDDFGLRWDQVIVGYPGQKISSRILTLPFGNLKKVEQTLEFELEGFIPFDLDKLTLDYHVLRATKESSDVLVFYTLKDEFAAWLGHLQNGKIDPKIVTAEASEYLNLVVLGMVPPEVPYAILDIGHSKTNIAICKGKELAYIRSVSTAGKHISEAIQKKLSVPYEEAERMKTEMGSVPSEDEMTALDDISKQVAEAIRQAVEELVVQVKQVFFAYQDLQKEPVEGIYLCGGTSRLPGLDRTLSLRLKQNVTHIDCTAFHFSRLGQVASHRALMPQGLALALRAVASGRMPSVNLRQGEFAFKGDIEKLGGTIRHAMIAVGVIFILGLSYFGVKYSVLSRQVKQLNKQVTEMVKEVLPKTDLKKISSPSAALKVLKNERTSMERRMEQLIAVQGVSFLDLMKEITVKVPSRTEIKLDVEDLNFKGENLRLGGSADSIDAVKRIETALEGSDFFERVTTPGGTRKGISENQYKFEMAMDVTPLKKKEEPKAKKGKKKKKEVEEE